MQSQLNLVFEVKPVNLESLPDEAILSGFELLVRRERRTQADFLLYLNEVDERKLFASEGYSGLYSYLVEKFNYGESSALRRIQIAKLAQKFEEVYSLLREGALSLRHLQVLAPKLTIENASRLFSEAKGKSVRELQVHLAGEFPSPETPDRVSASGKDRFHIQFSADAKFLDKLNNAKALLGRKHPSGRLALILEEALDLLLESEGNRQCRPVLTPSQEAFGITQEDVDAQTDAWDCLRDPEMKNTPYYIPRGIRREVWKRDKGCCQFPRKDGSKCGETRFLEFDHIYPWAWGEAFRRTRG